MGLRWAALILLVLPVPAPAQEPRGPLILVSLDGFRWDYRDKAPTPNLDKIVADGVHAQALLPVFPTVTFPNHYSIATGLYPDHHGIVANTMYDSQMDERFSIRNDDAVGDKRWWGGEPIWVTVQRQGLVAATHFWPGSEAPIQGMRPRYWKRFDGSIPPPKRVAQILEWLQLPPKERPSFLTLYFEDTDQIGHAFGPNSPEMVKAIERVDSYVGLLLDGLERLGLLGAAHVLITSDHGLAEVLPSRVIRLADYIDLSTVEVYSESAFLTLRPRDGNVDSILAILGGAHPHLHMYKKEEIPERFRYGRHHRVAPLVGLVDPGWKVVVRRPVPTRPLGDHGYDNRHPSMHGIFIAQGPAFKKGHEVRAFECIHLYPLMAHLLQIKPAPCDGTLDAVKGLLR